MDTVRFVLHLIGTLAMLAFGLTSFFRPQVVAGSICFSLQGDRGQAEFRVGLGGFFIGAALMALISQEAIAFQVLGASWLGGAVSRLLAFFVDRLPVKADYIGLFCLELTMGIFLLV